MASKAVSALVGCLLVFSIASAQEYSIRANRGLNLRAAPSLNAIIADTVKTGSILRVVGASGSWLKIDRFGREVWLADWVDYSRVDSSKPSGSQAPATPIDNCCFVDRQCQSDKEWIDGYRAFQNGQCVAPAQPQPASPAQPVSSAPANVDNCCFVDRQCQSEDEWLNGYWAFQNNQCPAPARPSAIPPSRPLIEGSSEFVRQVEAALNWLENQAPEWHNYVIDVVDKIFELANSGSGACWAFAYPDRRHVGLETCMSNWAQKRGISAGPRFDQLEIAAFLAHEACHIHTFEAGINYAAMGLDEEEECTKPMHGVMVALDPFNRYGTLTINEEPVLSVVRRYCSEGFSPELYCPAIQRLQGG
ncbi:MAG: SH3 domain-containing protein [Chloroflexi bacterium]|nr:SH3 domain-containing protein [Chloroflexota bacterium]